VPGNRGGALLAIVTALASGVAIGLVVGRGGGGKTGGERLAAVETERDGLRTRLRTTEARVADLTKQVKALRARGTVPSFLGKRIADVEGDRSVGVYNWRIRTRDRSSAGAPGTVLSQSPGAGATLTAGGAITVEVATNAPLTPRRWTAIGTFTGAGATRTDEFTIARGVAARLVYEMPDNGNNAIVLHRPGRGYGDLLINNFGPQRGVMQLHVTGTFYLQVTGTYKIQVQVLRRP
jgi:hypothetical protein